MSRASEPFVRVCGQPAGDGECANGTNTQWFEGHGWRCRLHTPEGLPWPHSRRGIQDPMPNGAPPPQEPTDPPKSGRIEDIADAQALIAWATENMATGRLSEARARGVINGATRYIRSVATVQGKDLMDRLEKAAVAMGALKETK